MSLVKSLLGVFSGSYSSRNSLISQWYLLNIFGLAMLYVAHQQGLLIKLIEEDVTGITMGLFMMFAVGLLVATKKALSLNWDINNWHHHHSVLLMNVKDSQKPSESMLMDALSMRLSRRLTFFRVFEGIAVAIGFMGTIIGVAIGFDTVPPDLGINIGSTIDFLSGILSGLKTSFNTTIVGGIAAIWFHILGYLMTNGTATLYERIVGGDA